MINWLYNLHGVAVLFFLLLCGSSVHSQVYAVSESSSANGVCIGCWVQNSGLAVDTGISSTYGTMRLTVGVLGASLTQRLTFGKAAGANQNIYIIMESANATLLSITALGAVQITSFYHGVSNADTKGAASISISILSGSSTKSIVTIAATKPFDAVEIKMNAGIASALTNMRIYSAYFTGAVLPVKLISFEGNMEEDMVRLRWATASEVNNHYFTVERSGDGDAFSGLVKIAGAGTINERRDYSYLDEMPIPGAAYYRLRQTDFDGVSDLSDMLSVSAPDGVSSPLQIRGNPLTDRLSFSYTASRTGHASIYVWDMQGRKIMDATEPCSAGINEYSSDITALLPSGRYTLQLVANGQSQFAHIVRQ